ncbi:MAG: hypothetical protein V4450_07345 [Bacteroidota bacterium]
MITLEQIKKDIADGKGSRIYYSAHTLWWTHLDTDVETATEMGKQASDSRMEQMLADPTVPEEQKTRIKALRNSAPMQSTVPLDPSGSPLYQMDDVEKWIRVAEEKPAHFGKHGLDAFVKAHHQNCEGIAFQSWDHVNQVIDSAK